MKKTIYLIVFNFLLTFCTIPHCLSQFLDPSFGTGGIAGPFNNGFLTGGEGEKIHSAQSMTVDNNGRILIVGHKHSGINEDLAVMRLNPDGTPDPTYGTAGVVKFADFNDVANSNEYGTVIAFNAGQNTITLAGYRHYLKNNLPEADIVVMQLNADGSVNNNFGQAGKRVINTAVNEEVYAITFGSGSGTNGIFLGGFASPSFVDQTGDRGRVWRMGNTGANLSNFAIDFANATCHILALAIDAGGFLLAGGDNSGGPSRLAIARVTQNGSYDTFFDGDGKAFINAGNTPSGITQIKVQPDTKILVTGGMFDILSQKNGTVVARLHSNGAVDANFSGGSRFIPFEYTFSTGAPRSLVLQADGKIITSGLISGGGGTGTDFGLARLNADGSIDIGFGTNGFYSYDYGNGSIDVNNCLLLQPDGKVLSGTMTRPGSDYSFSAGIVRLQFTDPAPCITGVGIVCSGLSPVSYTGPDNMDSYSWSVTGNASIITPANQQGINVAVGNGNTPSFTVTLTTTKNGSPTTCSKTVTVTFETCQISGPSITCGGITTFTGPPNMTFYSWSVQGSGTIPGPSGQQTVGVQSGGGNYTLLLNAKGGCTYNCSTNVIVNPAPPCNITGASIVNAFTTNPYTGPQIPGTYNWSLTGSGGSITGATNAQSVNVTAGGSGTFTLRLVTNVNGCTSTINCQFPVTVNAATSACTYTQDIFSKKNNKGCLNGTLTGVTQLMQNSFGATSNSKVFGSTSGPRFFTLYRSDISNGNIYKMLPGFDGAAVLLQDVTPPLNGAFYDDKTTWPLVPIPTSGMQKGQISNTLLSHLMVLWFNLANNNALGNISLDNNINILTTRAATSCGNNSPTGIALDFIIPQNVVTALNNQNLHPRTVNGLFLLANDVLGGVVTSITAADARDAVEMVNNAFSGCRILTGTSSSSAAFIAGRSAVDPVSDQEFSPAVIAVKAFPNPYNKVFRLQINTPVSGMAQIVFYSADGAKVFETRKFVSANINNYVNEIKGPSTGSLFYKVIIGKHSTHGVVTGMR